MSTTDIPGPPMETPSFEPRPTLQYTATVGMQAALVGAFVSSVQNALGTHSKGASGFLSRTGGTIGFFGPFHSHFIEFPNSVILFYVIVSQLPWVPHSPPPNPSSQTNGKSRTRSMA